MANSDSHCKLDFDLNALPHHLCSPNLEPKLEPFEIPNPNPSFPKLPPSGHGGEAHSSLVGGSAIESGSGSTVVLTDAGPSTAFVASKNSRRRSSEMVRVPIMNPEDWAYFRALVRCTRIVYESLRIFLEHYGDASSPLAVKRRRFDTKSSELMNERDLWLNRDKRIIGHIPGIEIGDVFFYRAELCVVGLHSQSQAGIDYVTANQSPRCEPIATSIIVSGGYEDDVDRGYELIYTGHGGQDPKVHKQCVHQKLERGNLALERSRTYGIEIRVIRKVKCDKSPNGKVYVYDGLYNVVDYWLDVGKSGFSVFKFRLLRIEGQKEMGSSVMKLAEDLKVNPLTVHTRRYLSLDISMGSESIPVWLFNELDDSRDPLLFGYQARPVYPPALLATVIGDSGGGCTCLNNCTIGCHCAVLNGGEFPYVANGILLRGKSVLYECGPFCRCPPSCPNRVSQKGVINRLEVFRSAERRWGVRSLDLIRAGTFICEMSGFVLNRDGFVNPKSLPERWVEWGEISGVLPEYTPTRLPSLQNQDFSTDVPRVRNVSCYMSHSNSPNVFVQFVLYDHYNVSFPHLMIFALETIPPLRELSIDYGMEQEFQRQHEHVSVG